MKQEKNIFIDFLRKKDLKLTKQREIILNAFLKTERHLSTEELYDVIRKKDSKIGQATVFRTLKLLAQAQVARQIDLGGKIKRFEHKYGHQHHDHLICTECGKFIEAVDLDIERLQNKLCRRFEFKSASHRLEIFGICKICRKGGKKQ